MRPVLVVVALLLPARAAFCKDEFYDPYDLPEAPRPPTLPELSHPDLEVTSELTIGTLLPSSTSPTSSREATNAYIERLGAEAPVLLRRWFVGATYEAALGVAPEVGGPLRLISGNTELYGRTLWATRTGLAFGGGLGIVPPIAAFDRDSPASHVGLVAASLRPWDLSLFDADSLTFRPFVDVRALDGGFVLQFRERVNWSIATGPTPRALLSADSFVYAGYRIGPYVDVGVEASETYLINANVSDANRAYFSVAPGVRFMTRWVQPAVSVFTSLNDPLYPNSSRAWGVRLGFTLIWDVRARTLREQK